MGIHPTAIIEDGAEIDPTAQVGPYCRVGGRTKVAAGVRLLSHVVVEGRTEIGARTIVHPFAVLGGPPQHLGYRGEDTRLVIGADNVIREHTTINIGAPVGGSLTRVGDRGYFMTGAHIAHDCIVGNDVIFANNATLGGHVVVEDGAFLGGLCAIHQHCRIGAFAFIGGCAAVTGDVIPYGSAVGNHARLEGLNIIGLKRRGLSREVIHEMRAAFRLLFAGEGAFQERLAEAERRYAHREEIMRIIAFIKTESRRPIMAAAR
ncbi:acyl-ACP--UDP-N-acetylglucosamine O-acyltransferase [Amphiplicatus metriothermophilus]|uniref:Acyl-[acyl-carrier-protein]--UDP-N-acetylglucosamine O-acyltransferase n=1 Tax=Amphiplicatus metriothermophilus TaxID=1519374 RepID=A0A239PQK5_9PROT|nr:acyl-ACP--UDP-N-acetylglucosamine O-acyltransferase [Amphiplicatus metriothermophilus]MBB5518516.1 UDP-N-acetylglucosamine acyltransferase [Amphiplicatus metriothermophilus]SNT72323.1 acyl-[acyl-carrier-protein]--UDP-N-acetylglucosamine O-acyltransferase [Amphiplicatus metriothermophilus]